MTIKECSERWLIQVEKNICRIENEFCILNEAQLNYRLHIHHCNIKEIMGTLYHINASLLPYLSQPADIKNHGREYKPTLAGRYFHSRAWLSRCLNRKKSGLPLPDEVDSNRMFTGLLEQEKKLKEIISSCPRLDIHKKIVPFMLFGLIKLNLADTIEYIMICHQKYLTRARYLLKIQ